jgi:hypothetical protein
LCRIEVVSELVTGDTASLVDHISVDVIFTSVGLTLARVVLALDHNHIEATVRRVKQDQDVGFPITKVGPEIDVSVCDVVANKWIGDQKGAGESQPRKEAALWRYIPERAKNVRGENIFAALGGVVRVVGDLAVQFRPQHDESSIGAQWQPLPAHTQLHNRCES